MYTMFHYFSPFSLYFGSFVWRPLFKFRAESYKKSRMCRGILGDGWKRDSSFRKGCTDVKPPKIINYQGFIKLHSVFT